MALINAVMTTPAATAADLSHAAANVDTIAHALVGDREPSTAPRLERNHGDYLPRSPVVGAASPLAPGTFAWDIVDGRFVATGLLTAAYEGPPGFVHGGMIALVFDEILGIVNIANGCPGMTGTLNIKYRQPTPLYRPLRWEAWIDQRIGRRVMSHARVRDGETLCAEASGVFVELSAELRRRHFGDAAG